MGKYSHTCLLIKRLAHLNKHAVLINFMVYALCAMTMHNRLNISRCEQLNMHIADQKMHAVNIYPINFYFMLFIAYI